MPVKDIPEAGGRIQFPLPKGEAALTYHHRTSDVTPYSPYIPITGQVGENRYAFDARFDVEVGLWCEAAWISKTKNTGLFSNQHLLTLGTDYTFDIGNGLGILFEHFIFSLSEKSFDIADPVNFSATSLNYPLTIDDHINIISFYDWGHKTIYYFGSWKHNFGKIAAHLMLYINPKNYMLPLTGNASVLYAGNGIQLMIIYKH